MQATTNYKKPLLIGLIVITIAVIGLNILIWAQRGRQAIEPGSLPQTSLPATGAQPNFTYNYVTELPQMPDSATVYRVVQSEVASLQTAQKYAQGFGVTVPPQPLDDISGTVYLFTISENEYFTVYPQPVRVEYENYGEITPSTLPVVNLFDLAEDFFSDKNLFGNNITLSQPYGKLISTAEIGEGFFEVATIADADNLQVFFDLAIDGYPVVTKDRQNSLVEVLMNLDGSVRKATITLLPDQLTSSGIATLTTPAQALEAINVGGGIISRLNNPTQAYTRLAPREVSTATLTSVELVYVYDHDINMLQPYYRFSGNAETTSGVLVEVEVLITALSQEVFE